MACDVSGSGATAMNKAGEIPAPRQLPFEGGKADNKQLNEQTGKYQVALTGHRMESNGIAMGRVDGHESPSKKGHQN